MTQFHPPLPHAEWKIPSRDVPFLHYIHYLLKSTTTKRQWLNKQKLGPCQSLYSYLLYHRFHEMFLVSSLQKHWRENNLSYTTCWLKYFQLFLLEIFLGGLKSGICWFYCFLKKIANYLFFSKWSSLCRHFCMISVLLFRDSFLSANIMEVFSSRQRLHSPDSLL